MKLLEGIVMPPGYRFNLVFAYLFLVLEHQKAIVVLVDSELHGSAFALLRLQVEAAFRGLWVGRVANDQQVEDIAKRGIEPFGNFKDMAKNVDEAYQANGKLKSIIEEGGWKTLNALTHSGLDQLVRRFSDDETFGPNYADDETKALLEFSGAVTSIMALFIFHANGFNEKFKALELWQKDNRKNVGQGLGNEAIDQ
jgi:hypothetical protein